MPVRSLSAEALAAAIRSAVGDAALRQRAVTLVQQISGEDGVGQAVTIIEQYI